MQPPSLELNQTEHKLKNTNHIRSDANENVVNMYTQIWAITFM